MPTARKPSRKANVPLLFGIPSLDELVDMPFSSQEHAPPESTTLSILGPDGTGKSVLALHLASRYHFECMRRLVGKSSQAWPVVLYVSSDLRYRAAFEMWKRFGLHHPGLRYIPFERTAAAVLRYKDATAIREQVGNNAHLHMRQLAPYPGNEKDLLRLASENVTESSDILAFAQQPRKIPEVGFVDLAQFSAGDDWTFVNTLLGKLGEIRQSVDPEWPHLVIIDSVAGFETFVGEIDAYGLEQTRRTRIAQCIRNAGEKCHLVFTVEEPKENEHQPEEFVTDVVIRLRRRQLGSTTIRTLEIEKARARAAALGEHPFEINPAQGTSTGDWQNADRPRSNCAYVHVHQSLPHRTFLGSADPSKGRPGQRPDVAAFGIKYLDDLLPAHGRNHGVESGTVTALIGNVSTGKSALAEQFLAEGFRELVQAYFGLVAQRLKLLDRGRRDELYQFISDRLSRSIIDDTRVRRITDDPGRNYENWSALLHESIRRSEVRLRALYKADGVTERPQPASERAQAFGKLLFPLPEEKGGPTIPYSRLSQLHTCYVEKWTHRRNGTEQWKSVQTILQSAKYLFFLPHFQQPAVLLTTSDVTSRSVAERICQLLQQTVRKWTEPLESHTRRLNDTWKAVRELVESQLIVRRFNASPMPAASVFDLIQRNVVLAQQQRLHYWFPAKQRIRYEGSDRTRLVIDDLATLASVSPEIESDTSFLPFVTFYLGREGITSLIVHTDNVRPDSKPSAGLTRRLEEVAKRTIMVWSVPFEGQDRIALTVPPAGGSDESGLIRELAWTQLEPLSRLREAVSRSRPIVTPRFELYSGVARREPKRIPLAVYLYEETEAFGEYLEREELLFRQMFVPSARNGTVLVAIEADRVAAIREFCMLPLDAQEDHSIVFQVDLHWIMKTDLTERQEHRPHGALTNQTHYGFEAFHKDREIRLCQDPFGLFQNYQGPEKVEDDRRIDYFENKFYVARAKSATIADETFRMIGIDRVPYMWDFGFLLLRRATWEQAKKCIVRPKKTVGQVWEQLGNRKVVSWRDFLGACSEVVKYSRLLDDQRRIAFDVAGRSADSMGCFVLEIWMSEMKAMAASTRGPKGLARLSDALNVLSTPKYAPEEFHKRLSLTQVLSPIKRSHEEEFRNARGKGGNVSFGAFALYKVWRLLLEVLDFDSILSADGFNIRLSPNGSSSSVATRHWYKTACEFSAQLTKEGGDEATPWPLRLPGNYSVRGDWFLASPATSRSALLARHAIDLLCSRRSNITRMQFGLGLPVRDVLDDTGSRLLRTALRRPSGFTGERDLAELTYEELCWLGAPKESHGGAGSFRWLWRTSIKDYDRINQAFLKWIARVIQWTVDYRRAQRSNWIGGFATYDRLSQGNPRAPGFESFIEFGQLCDLFLSDLKAASREDGPAEAGFRWTVRRSDGE